MAYKLIREEDFNTYTIKHFQCDELSDRATILSDYANPEVPKNALHAGWTATVTTTSSGKTVSFVLANDLSSWAEVAISKGGDPGSDYFPLIAETEAVMTNDENGDPTAVAYSESATPNTFPIRDDDGEIAVGTPTKDSSAVNKESLEDGTVTVADAVHAQNADIADQINTDREIEDAEEACPPVVFGTIGGAAEVQDGLMKFPELRGHTIKWNQLCYDPNCTDATVWNTYDSTYAQVVSVSNNEIEVEIVQNDASAQYNYMVKEKKINRIGGVIGHKYAFWAEIFSAKAGTFVVSPNNDSTPANGSVAANTWTKIIGINTASRVMRYMSAYPNFEPEIGDTYKVRRFGCCDLTDIYGAGNEPSTVAEFVRDFPMPYYTYNAGTLLSSKSSSVDFVKRNQWDEVWEYGGSGIRGKNLCPCFGGVYYYVVCPSGAEVKLNFYDANGDYIKYQWAGNRAFPFPANACWFKVDGTDSYGSTTYNHDICIYINWETPGLPYVPHSKQHIVLPNLELRSAGTAYDLLYQPGGGKRNITRYTFTGNEQWVYRNTASGVDRYMIDNAFAASLASIADNTTNVICSVGESGNGYSGTVPNTIETSGRNIYVCVATGVNPNTVWSSGVVLDYALATGIDITTTENPGWTEYAEIDNFGTVKFNQDPAQTVPVPQAYFVRYTVNLVEFLDSAYVRAEGDAGNLATQSDLSGYVAKQTGATTYNQAYIKNADGSQSMVDMTNAVAANGGVRRDATGQINLPNQSNYPPSNDQAVSKKYVDDTTSTSVSALQDNIENGTVVAKESDHASVADNLSPYSDESGTTQDAPFISQGTGTANNTASVDTGAIAKVLVKQGNTVVRNQLAKDINNTNWASANTSKGTVAFNNGEITYTVVTAGNSFDNGIYSSTGVYGKNGHKYLLIGDFKGSKSGIKIGYDIYNMVNNYLAFATLTTSYARYATIITAGSSSTNSVALYLCTRDLTAVEVGDTISAKNICLIDLTAHFNGNANIPQDLLDHPDHWSWYDNGTDSYNTGTMTDCNGRYLVCTGRQLWDEQVEVGGILENTINSKNYIWVIPSKQYYLYCGSASGYFYVYYYDANGTLINNGGTATSYNSIVTTPPNCRYMKFRCTAAYGTTYNHDITISLYYSPEEGGEGYSEQYPYVEPKVYDTGTEQLIKARNSVDDKVSNGTVTRRNGAIDLGTIAWDIATVSGDDTSIHRFISAEVVAKGVGGEGTTLGNGICSHYDLVTNEQSYNKVLGIAITQTGRLSVYDPSKNTMTSSEFTAAMDGVMLYYELATPTTEQGTTFPDYIDINDYGMMYWLDTDGNLVSIPQGIRLFYPVDYKAFLDTLNGYTEGDPENIALKGELASGDPTTLKGVINLSATVDGQLKEALGGTLRQLLAVSKNLNFDDTAFVDLGTLSWTYYPTGDLFVASITATNNYANAICSNYLNKGLQSYDSQQDKTIQVRSSAIYLRDTSKGTDDTAFKAAMKGVLLAYEKAST